MAYYQVRTATNYLHFSRGPYPNYTYCSSCSISCSAADSITDSTPATMTSTILPTHLPPSALNFTWGDKPGANIFEKITSGNEEVIHWRPNLFLVPFGSAGNAFVSLLPRCYCCRNLAKEAKLRTMSATSVKDWASGRMVILLSSWMKGDTFRHI